MSYAVPRIDVCLAGGFHRPPGGVMAAYVYILASRRNGTLYIGVTNDLRRRVSEHRDGVVAGFTRRYGVKMLVYFEEHESIVAAIQREKTLKHWVRRWKLNIIEGANPDWRDLWDDVGSA